MPKREVTVVVGLPSAEKYTPGPDRRGLFACQPSKLQIRPSNFHFDFDFDLRLSFSSFFPLQSPARRQCVHCCCFILIVLFSDYCPPYYTPPVAQTVQYHRPCQCIPGMAPRPTPPPPLLDLASTPPPPLLSPPYKCLGYDGSLP